MSLTMRQFRDIVVKGETLEGVNKGVLLSSAGGVLPPAAHREFMQRVETGQVFLQNANVINVTRPSYELHHLSAASRQMKVATPGTAVTTGTVTPVERTLNPTRALLPLDVSYDWIDDNADERDADMVIRDYLADLMAADIVDLAGNGDGSTGTFLSINSGFPVLAAADSDSDVNTYDATNTTFLGASGILSLMRAQLPTQYHRDAVFYMAMSELWTLMDELGTRATMYGDDVLKNGGPITWQGMQVLGVPNWPVDKIILTPKWNLAIGVWHMLRVSATDEPRKSCIEYTVDSRIDFNYANGSALVYGTTD